MEADVTRSQHSSRDHQKQDGVDEVPHVDGPRSPTRTWRWDERFDTMPLTVGQVRWVDVGVHSQSLPNHLPGRHTFSDRF